MKPNRKELLDNYFEADHFGVPCFINNPKLDKLLTGEGSKTAKKLYPEFISFDAVISKEDKYKMFKTAEKINDNSDVAFFNLVSSSDLSSVHIEFWGSEELYTASRFLEEDGNALLGFLTNK